MRRLSILAFCVGFLAIGAAGSARAATLDFMGTLRLQFGTWPRLSTTGALSVSTAGSALVNGSATTIHLSSLVLGGGTFGPVTTTLSVSPWSTGVQSVRYSNIMNLGGSFAGLSGGPPGSGTMGLQGLAKICIIFSSWCDSVGISIPLTPTTGGAGFGIGGTETVPTAVAVTVQHASWTIGQPVLTIHTPNSAITTPTLPGGFAHGPASLTSSTAQTSGVVQLVTVSKVFTSLSAAIPELPMIGVLTLHFVPEPGTPLLLGSVVAALAILGRRHGRR
jgi:hypothetical protein